MVILKTVFKKLCQKSRRAIGLGLVVLLMHSAPIMAENVLEPSYQWGRGYHIPSQNFSLGGYAKASYSYFEATPQELALDDLSLFIAWKPFAHLHLFAELELEDLFTLEGVTAFDDSFLVERLYADVLIDDSFKLRIGKFLTPFSRWNLLHAAPLVWTSSRPMITKGFVAARHSTGLELLYKTSLLNRDFNVSLFADDSKDLEIKSNLEMFSYAFGSRINYQLSPHFNIAGSYIAHKKEQQTSSDWQHTVGVDFLWQQNNYELQFEGFYNARGQATDQYGLYLQGVAPLVDKLFAVGRYEYMYTDETWSEASSSSKSIHVGVVGLTWRPKSPLALKVEYRFGQNNKTHAPSGVLTSVALFF